MMERFSLIVEKLVNDSDVESQEPDFSVSDIEGEHRVIDLRKEPAAAVIYNEECTDKEIKSFNKWLRSHANDYVRLYHGTASKFDILNQGILKTTPKRRNSYQSENGYVYLSLYPSSARMFGEMAYPRQDVTVYAVDVKIKELHPDLD